MGSGTRSLGPIKHNEGATVPPLFRTGGIEARSSRQIKLLTKSRHGDWDIASTGQLKARVANGVSRYQWKYQAISFCRERNDSVQSAQS